MRFVFGQFTLDARQKTVWWKSTRLAFTPKSFELLHYLVSRSGQLISRDELVESVWRGRIVTDNTIDQCILKIRKALTDAQPGDYIESVYGQGVRFLPKVQKKTANSTPAALSNKTKSLSENRGTISYWQAMTAIMVLTLLGMLRLWLQKPDLPITEQSSLVYFEPISNRPSEFPPPVSNHDWLEVGSRSFLLQLLDWFSDLKRVTQQGNSQIEYVYPNGKAALSLSLPRRLPKGGFSLHYILDPHGSAETARTIEKESLSALYQAFFWQLEQKFERNSKQLGAGMLLIPDSSLALENHHKAVQARLQGKSALALEYTLKSTSLAPNFLPAWYEMAVAYRDQGRLDKALAVTRAVQAKNNPVLHFRFILLQAQLLDQLGKYNEAWNIYQDAAQRAREGRQTANLASILISEAILDRKLKNFNRAEKALKEARKLVTMEENPTLYGAMMGTWARLDKAQFKLTSALEKAALAKKAHLLSGHLKHGASIQNLQADVLSYMNRWEEAEEIVKNTLGLNENIKNRRGECDNRVLLSKIYQSTGRLALAAREWKKVIECTSGLNLPGNQAMAYLWMIRLEIKRDNLSHARLVERRFDLHVHEQNDKKDLKELLLRGQLELAIAEKEISKSQAILKALEKASGKVYALYRADIALLQGHLGSAEKLYWHALNELPENTPYSTRVEYQSRLAKIYARNNPGKLRQLVEQMKQFNPFCYPVKKYESLILANDNQLVEAIMQMEELKLQAGELWRPQDELLLSRLRKHSQGRVKAERQEDFSPISA